MESIHNDSVSKESQETGFARVEFSPGMFRAKGQAFAARSAEGSSSAAARIWSVEHEKAKRI